MINDLAPWTTAATNTLTSLFPDPDTKQMLPPLTVVFLGTIAGLFATFFLSLLIRLLTPGSTSGSSKDDALPDMGPQTVLTQEVSPGPEGLAEQFAFKFAAGIYGVNIASRIKLFGFLVHVAYGIFWGILYALIQETFHFHPLLFGSIFGFFVWLIGPGIVIPPMGIIPYPNKLPFMKVFQLIVGHILYGIVVALVFSWSKEILL